MYMTNNGMIYSYFWVIVSVPSKMRRTITFSCASTFIRYIYIYRIVLLSLGTPHCLCVYMVAQLNALSAQQNKHFLSVQFSERERWSLCQSMESQRHV